MSSSDHSPSTSGLTSYRKLAGVPLSHTIELTILGSFLCFSLLIPSFWGASNFRNLLTQMAPLLLLAVGQTFVLVVGGIDLTQGAVVGLSSVVFFLLLQHVGLFASVFITLGIFAAIGFCLGVLLPRSGIDPLVATLAMMYVVVGVTMLWTGGTPITSTDKISGNYLRAFGTCSVGVLPGIFLAAGAAALCAHFLLRHTNIGLHLYATGSSPRAASTLGISKSVSFGVAYSCSAAGSVLASVLLTSRIQQGNPQLGEGLLFDSIGGAVLGGVALSGGIGSVWTAVRGVLLLGLIQNALYLTDLNSHVRDIVVGVLILVVTVVSYRMRLKSGGMQ